MRACRRGFGTAAAVRALVGGDGLRSVAGGRGSRGEDGDERVSEGFQRGSVALSRSTREEPGRQGGRRWPGHVATRAGRVPLSSWREEGDDWRWPVSLVGLLGQNSWAAR